MNEQKDGGVWARCGRCLGTGSVSVTSGHVVICPECSGKGSKKIGQVQRDKGLEKKSVPGRFVITLDQLPSQKFNLDEFKISVNLTPFNLPIAQMEILKTCDWDAIDEATAETAYVTSSVLSE